MAGAARANRGDTTTLVCLSRAAKAYRDRGTAKAKWRQQSLAVSLAASSPGTPGQMAYGCSNPGGVYRTHNTTQHSTTQPQIVQSSEAPPRGVCVAAGKHNYMLLLRTTQIPTVAAFLLDNKGQLHPQLSCIKLSALGCLRCTNLM